MSDPLIALFAEGLRVDADKLDDSSSPDTVPEWDSLAAMDLVALLEDAFGVQFTTREMMKMRTVGIARQVLREKGAEV